MTRLSYLDGFKAGFFFTCFCIVFFLVLFKVLTRGLAWFYRVFKIVPFYLFYFKYIFELV